ncbi:MAG: NADH-quinone oxidoreductase subunit J [Chloroflexota bacterium]|nr:NADH-quinone oxidoreductase subunit J [Chloroflexota bacterium]
MITEIAFWVIAVLLIGSALAVVLLKDIFKAALFLILCFFTVAALYITLNADFLAAVQVLVYIGAIGILLMFAIMLTRELSRGSPFNKLSLPALVVAGLVLVMIVVIVVSTDWGSLQVASQGVQMAIDEPTTGYIAEALFDKNNGFVLPFEIASVLLLAALIGAIVLVRGKEKE